MPPRRREAKGGSRGAAEAAPQYFQVACPDGHRLRGLRTGSYQALRCPECGNGVFVLPRSPLPAPPPPTGRAARNRPKPSAPRATPSPPSDEGIEYSEAPVQLEAKQQSAEIVWDDELPPSTLEPDHEVPEEYRAPKAPADSPPRPVPRPKSAPAPEPEPITAAATKPRRRPRPAPSPEPESEPARERKPDLGRHIEIPESPRGKRGRVGLVIAGVILLAGGTFAWRMWQSRLEKLPAEAEENWESGIAALDAGEFDSARQKLARAADAFERLGGHDERTPQARQLARESAILADTLNLSLEELIDEAARQDDPDRWTSRFDTLYKGRSIIIDTTIEGPPPAGAAPGEYPLALRVLLGRGPKPARTGRIDLTGFELFAGDTLSAGDPVLFGARLASVELNGRDWVIRLEPDSGVLMTRFETLQIADWDPNQSARTAAEQPRLDPAMPARGPRR